MTHTRYGQSVIFRSRSRADGRKEDEVNRDTDPDTVTQCLLAQPLPNFLDKLVTLRKNVSSRVDTDK